MRIFSTIIVAALLAGCTAKTPPAEPTHIPTAPASALFLKIKEKPAFQQLKINSRVTAETGKFIPTLDATIYIENGQKVWMNLIAVFLNVGRGIATPDGIRGYEKWNKTYIESDFTYLNNLLNVNFLDFSSLQNLLLGRSFIDINEKDFTSAKNTAGYRLTSVKNLKFTENGKVSEFNVALQYSPVFDLMNITLANVRTKDVVEISYTDWVNFDRTRLPKNVKIVIKGDKASQIYLENTKFESSKMETPYAVPANYMKTEIR